MRTISQVCYIRYKFFIIRRKISVFEDASKIYHVAKKQKLLVHDGYCYSRKTNNKSSITWRCVEHNRSKACSVIIHTTSDEENGSVIGEAPKHEHTADVADIEARVIRSKLKRHAVRSEANPLGIIADNLKNADSPVVAQLGKMASMQRVVQRARQQLIPQVQGTHISDFVIRDDVKMTAKNQLFLQYDSGRDKNRFLIFSTASNLNKLATCEVWCGDGTFQSVPAIFKQLYSFHGVIDGHTLPLVYVLSPRKSQSIYLKILSKIKELLPNIINVRRMLIDFEIAFIKAFKTVFRNVEVSGCYFHFTQCVWRHIQSEGLQSWYNNSIRVAQNIKMLYAIAFVPPNDVIMAYEDLLKSPFYVKNEGSMSGLLDYYEYTWIGVLKRNKDDRSAPLFAIEEWNCYESVMTDEIRSNNGIEGWHRSFNALVRVHHANLSKFISKLRDQQTIVELKLTQKENGVPLPKRRRKYCDYDTRLKNIVTAYDGKDKVQYLKNIANVLQL